MIKGSKFKANLERNGRLYNYWKLGKTVKETALITGIPESSVGYYFAKFNKYAARGEPIPVAQKMVSAREEGPIPLSQEDLQAIKAVLQFFSDSEASYRKFVNLAIIEKLLMDGDYQKLYYLLSSLKLFKEVTGMFKPTEGEYKVLLATFNRYKKEIDEHVMQLKFIPPDLF